MSWKNAIVLAALIGGALSSHAVARERLSTDFAPLDTSKWVLKGADVQLRDGKLLIASGKGNQYLTTRKRFLYASNGNSKGTAQ